MEVCTAEQKIAYNLAFRWADLYQKSYDEATTEILKSEIIFKTIRFCIDDYRAKNDSKYNLDAIQCALNAGMKNFFDTKYKILTSYEDIGKTFPAYYL